MGLAHMILTREHGTWAILIVPMVAGFVAADAFTLHSLFYMLASLGFFLAHHPLEASFHEHLPRPGRHALLLWSAGFALFGTVWLLTLLLAGNWQLVPIGGLTAAAVLARLVILRNRGRGIASDLIGAAGLSLGAPAAYSVSAGRLDGAAVLCWTVCALFFGSTVFYVHMKIAALKLKSVAASMTQRLSLGKMNLMYHGAVVPLVLGAAVGCGTPPAILLVLVPMTIHAVWGTVRLSRTVDLKRVGLLLVFQSLVFVLLLAFSGKLGVFR